MSATYKPARYLLRVDDLCPTVDPVGWRAARDMIREHGIRPILAVVPMNRDPQLVCAAPDPHFWEELRTLQDEGATIALHGYDHVCSSKGKPLIPLHERSEFAGLSLHAQQERIHLGLRVLRDHHLHPKLFVAPRHGLDANTLAALCNENLRYLSDGFTVRPHLCGGVIWIPQQLWAPASRSAGLWTICVHPRSFDNSDEWHRFLTTHRGLFTCFEEVASASALSFPERITAAVRLNRIRLRWVLHGRS